MKDAKGHGSDGRGGGIGDFGYRPHDPMPMNHTRIGLGSGTPGFSGKILNAGAMTDTQRTVSRIREHLQGVAPQSGHGAGLLQALKNLGGAPTPADTRRAFVGQFGNTGGSMTSRKFGRR